MLTTHLVGAVHLEVGHGEGRLVHRLLRGSNGVRGGVRAGLGLQAVHRDLLTMALLILTMALLTMALLTMALLILTMALLTMALLTMALLILTMALLTMALP